MQAIGCDPANHGGHIRQLHDLLYTLYEGMFQYGPVLGG